VKFLLLLASITALVAVAPAQAAAGVPEVAYQSATQVSTTGATLEATIDPDGSATSFEIFLECQSPEAGGSCGPLTTGPQREEGTLPAGSSPETVIHILAGLQPDYQYRYSVIATNASGREGFVGGGFVTCPSQGPCPGQPWMPGESLWAIEGGRRAAEEAPRLEAERIARFREAEELVAREAAERATKEREAREASECVVPRLKGDSLVAAVHALSRTRCVLGKVGRRHDHHGPLVVVRQSAPVGSRMAGGSHVAVTLGPGTKP
jgi:hypothetical protein